MSSISTHHQLRQRCKALAFLFAALLFTPFLTVSVLVHAEAAATPSVQLRLLKTLQAPFVINRLAWHPDNRQLATAQNLNKTILVWDTATSSVIHTIESEAGGVGALAYSQDGKYLAVGRIATRHLPDHAHIHIYDAKTGKLVRRLVPPVAEKGDANDIGALVISPNSRHLATHGYGGGAVGVIYELSNGKVAATLNPSTSKFDAVRSLSWSPDGRWVALGRGGRLELWNTTFWKLEKQRDVSRQRISALAFSPDNRRLAFGSMKVTTEQAELAAKDIAKLPENFRRNQPVPSAVPHDLRLLDTASLSVAGGFTSSHNGSAIKELAFTPDGKFLVSGANADSVAVHEVDRGTEVIFLKDLKPSAHPVPSRDGKYVVVGVGEKIQVYELRY